MAFKTLNKFNLTYIGILIVKVYQILISPFLPRSCRFHPTCSQYAIEALKERGFFLGGFLSLGRLLRCHPWSQGGFDPVKAIGHDARRRPGMTEH